MHRLIKEYLEEYLYDGPSQPKKDFEAHLGMCEECRGEVTAFQEHSLLLRRLGLEEELTPAPGFYARLMDRIEAQERASIWSVFLEPGFARRLVVGSATVLILLGGALYITEKDEFEPFAPVAAESFVGPEQYPTFGLGIDQQRDRETMFVTLATYRE